MDINKQNDLNNDNNKQNDLNNDKTKVKIKISCNYRRSFICWVVTTVISLCPSIIICVHDYLNLVDDSIWWTTLFGGLDILLVCASMCASIVFFINERMMDSAEENEKLKHWYEILFGLVIILFMLCVGIYSMQTVSEVSYINDLMEDINEDSLMEDFLAKKDVFLQKMESIKERRAKIGIYLFFSSLFLGLFTFFNIERG